MGIHLYTNGSWTDSGKIYRNSENLFDYNAYFNSIFIPYNEFFNYAELQFQPNTIYTLSTTYQEYMVSSTRITAFIAMASSGTPTAAAGGLSNISPVTLETESDGIIKLYKRISGASYSDMIPTVEQFEDASWIMLSEGSTILPYEPYNVVDWYTNNGHGYSSGAWT